MRHRFSRIAGSCIPIRRSQGLRVPVPESRTERSPQGFRGPIRQSGLSRRTRLPRSVRRSSRSRWPRPARRLPDNSSRPAANVRVVDILRFFHIVFVRFSSSCDRKGTVPGEPETIRICPEGCRGAKTNIQPRPVNNRNPSYDGSEGRVFILPTLIFLILHPHSASIRRQSAL